MDDPSDELLMAYADGELDAAETARIAAMLPHRPDLRARLAEFTGTGRTLGAYFSGPMHEPAPERHVDLVMGTAGRKTDAAQLDGAAIAALRSLLARVFSFELPRLQTTAAYAAVLLIGGVVGWYAATAVGPHDAVAKSLEAFDDGAILAGGGLERVLETTRSGQRVALAGSHPSTPGIAVLVRLSFKSSEGYCRQYDVFSRDALSSAGIACRGGDGRWRLHVHAARMGGPASASPGKSRLAGDKAHALLAAIIDETIEGEALGRDEESDALAKHWRR